MVSSSHSPFASTSDSAWRLLFLSFHFTGGSSCSCGNAYMSVLAAWLKESLILDLHSMDRHITKGLNDSAVTSTAIVANE
ncbi:hypothetical protein EV211_10438 [Aminicella lysinilytica]|uniref:Uncharacterized protein n=1 Tax=Aminicella lysinilytica TaxID=433323 RepID=A0A4R6QAZ8_9FIRM|nr:hypothetical protein EV211_10438 [Aminicella lysinilytica]